MRWRRATAPLLSAGATPMPAWPKTWDNYVEDAAIKAITVTQEITGAKTINALGFCVGGTILGTALAVLAASGEKPVASATFLTALLDFTDTGILDVFIDEAFVKYREQEMGQGGLLKGQELASTFSFLRPNDLVWNYVVGNYLKGETPPPFDLLYWNSDSTNLPGPFYAWYLRNTYLENKLCQPGKATVCGQKIDFRKLKLPVYIYGSREDHIVPIGGAYASTQHLAGQKRFVMGASGHIAGVINPPAAKNAAIGCVKTASFPPRKPTGRQAPPSRPAAGGPTGPAGCKATPANRSQPPRPTAKANTRPSSPRRAAMSKPRPDSFIHLFRR